MSIESTVIWHIDSYNPIKVRKPKQMTYEELWKYSCTVFFLFPGCSAKKIRTM